MLSSGIRRFRLRGCTTKIIKFRIHYNHTSSDRIPSHTLQISSTYSSVHRKSLHPLDLADQSIPKAAKFLQPVSPALLQDCAHQSDSRFILRCNSAHSQLMSIQKKYVLKIAKDEFKILQHHSKLCEAISVERNSHYEDKSQCPLPLQCVPFRSI